MEKFTTELEKILFEWLYKSQLQLAIELLAKRNKELLEINEPNTWPAQQEWNDMVGSSHSIFFKEAREKSNIPNDLYLNLLRNNEDAMEIAEPIYENSCA